jgi:hypothetical protein
MRGGAGDGINGENDFDNGPNLKGDGERLVR